MGASLAQNAVSLVDTFFLGMLGRAELAAGGISIIIFLTLGFIGLGLGTGVQVLSAQLLGEGQPRGLGSLLRQALWLSLFIGIALTLGLAWMAGPLTQGLLHDGQVQQSAYLLLRGRSAELLPAVLFGALRGYYSGTAQTTYILRANLLLAGVNLLLNALFVLGMKWGIWGVIAASVCAQYAATLYLLFALRLQSYPLRYTTTKRWLIPLLRYAGPSILQNLVGMTGWLVFFLLIEARGPLALASANILRSLYSFFMLPMWAFATAVGTLTGYFWGARQLHHLRQAFQKTFFWAQTLNLLLALLLMLFSSFWVGLFTQDAIVASQATRDLPMIAASLALMPASALLIYTVVGVGRVLAAFLVEVVIILCYVGYAVLLDRMGVSLTWMWSAEWVYWIPSAFVLGLILRKRLHSALHAPQPA